MKTNKNNSEQKFENLLSELRNKPIKDNANFKSQAEFKSEFFQKTKTLNSNTPKFKIHNLYKFVALFAIVGLLGYMLMAQFNKPVTCIKDTALVAKNDTSDVIVYEFSMSPPATALAQEDLQKLITSKESSTALEKAYRPEPQSSFINIDTVKFNTEEYKNFVENKFKQVAKEPLSTFGADVDTASYSNLRRMIMQQRQLPPRDAVRIEECINYFKYNYPNPEKNKNFSITFEAGDCPWATDRKLLLVGFQAKKIDLKELPPSNFVFLIDNSGSMGHVMPLVIKSMEMLSDILRPEDRISIVTYGGGVSVLLDSATGNEKPKVKSIIQNLNSSGYTPGGAGIVEAYKLAQKNFIPQGNNRVVLITDGDFNVGTSSESELVQMVENRRNSGVYLSIIGVGMGNYKDNKIKMLANKGNGNYSYVDNEQQARKSLVDEATGQMFTLAKDVKFQVEFNPEQVYAYRLVGYEMRNLANSDFNDDTKDSGEVGVGHQVTALYELIMADASTESKKAVGSVDDLKYQAKQKSDKSSAELLTFKLRYQQPNGKTASVLEEFVLAKMPKSSENWQWASGVAEFGLLLRDSENKGNANFEKLRQRVKNNLGEDSNGERAEFLVMLKTASDLMKNK